MVLGVAAKDLKPIILAAGMSEEVHDLIIAHSEEGKTYEVTVDSDSMQLTIKELTT